MKSRIFSLAICLVFSAVFTANVFAQVTVSGGLALSTLTGVEVGGEDTGIKGGIGIGANVLVDYLLPISIPLSLGFEVGVDFAKYKVEFGDDEGTASVEGDVTAIPLLLRAAYHFDIIPKLDLYAVGKIGYVIGNLEGESLGGLGFGIDAGVGYYFNSKLGVFGEVGFDRYMLKKEVDGFDVKGTFSRFATFGVSAKF